MEKDYFSDGFVEDAEAFSCRGIVKEERIGPHEIKQTGETTDHYFLTIQPTNYEGKPIERRIKLSDSRNGKWLAYLKACKDVMAKAGLKYQKCGDLVGHEFQWKDKVIGSWERDGEQQQNRALLPVELLTKAGGAAKDAAPADNTDASATIVDVINVNGPMTRADIAKATGLSALVVTKTADALIDAGKLVTEGDMLRLP